MWEGIQVRLWLKLQTFSHLSLNFGKWKLPVLPKLMYNPIWKNPVKTELGWKLQILFIFLLFIGQSWNFYDSIYVVVGCLKHEVDLFIGVEMFGPFGMEACFVNITIWISLSANLSCFRTWMNFLMSGKEYVLICFLFDEKKQWSVAYPWDFN